MKFRLVWYYTDSDNKYDSNDRFEIFGDRDSIWRMWYVLTRELTRNNKHVEVYSLDGTKQEPEKGICGMIGYNL